MSRAAALLLAALVAAVLIGGDATASAGVSCAKAKRGSVLAKRCACLAQAGRSDRRRRACREKFRIVRRPAARKPAPPPGPTVPAPRLPSPPRGSTVPDPRSSAPPLPATPGPELPVAPSPAPVPPTTPVSAPPVAAPPAIGPELPAADPPAPLARTVQVRATEFALSLSRAVVGAGTVAVEYTLERAEDPHDLRIRRGSLGPAVAIWRELAPAELEVKDVELTPGEYSLLCTLPGHAELGMTAKLRVQ